MRAALVRHDALIEDLTRKWNGVVIHPRGEGDSRFLVFPRATDAVAAAAAIQQALYGEPWPAATPLLVRMALHTGEADLRDGDYYGTEVNRCARLRSIAHGGQTLLSRTTYDLVRHDLPLGIGLRDMGMHGLADLTASEHVYQLTLSALPSDFPPHKSVRNRPNNLPGPVTRLVGREREVKKIITTLRRPVVHLLTLTGPGGVGKTRLALRVAADSLDEFPDGVFHVPLAPIAAAELVVPTIVQTLGLREAGTAPLLDHLKGHLRDKTVLLVLDNFEHLIPAATAVSELLAACSRLKILVTSRAPLRILAEREFPVDPFPVPVLGGYPSLARARRYAAIQFFVDRASAVDPRFSLTAENVPTVVDICSRLDGLPLAIELAAAKIRVLRPHALLARLHQSLDLLDDGPRDLMAHQRSLRKTIEWSYNLLSEPEQRLFRRVSIFSGGCSLQAVEALFPTDRSADRGPHAPAQAVLDGLSSLVGNSLLRQETPDDGELRFGMLETIHEYGLERLETNQENALIHDLHAGYFLTRAEEAEGHLYASEQITWLNQLDRDRANFRGALRWLIDQSRSDDAVRLAAALRGFWEMRGYLTEGRAHLREVLDLGNTTAPAPSRMLALFGAARLALLQNDSAESAQRYHEAEMISRMLSDRRGIARSLLGQGWVAAWEEDNDNARTFFTASLAICRELGNPRELAIALINLGEIALRQGDLAEARMTLQEGLTRFGDIGDRVGITSALRRLGTVACEQGDYARARENYAESLGVAFDVDYQQDIAEGLENFAILAVAEDREERALRLAGSAAALRDRLAVSPHPYERRRLARSLEQVKLALPPERYARLWQEGSGLTVKEAIKEALDKVTVT
jgi:predicted ATPase